MQILIFLSFLMISCTNFSNHCKFQLTMYKTNTDDNCRMYGCESGWYGPLCNKQCSRQCKFSLCRQNDGMCVNGCKNGFLTHRRCRVSTNKRIKRSGDCHMKHSKDSSRCVCCSEGYRGDSCNISCENCKTFNGKTSGGKDLCKYMCKVGYYGNYCNNTCSESCQKSSKGIPICELKSGNFTCSNGCIRGYHGSQCNKLCSKYCQGNICRQDEGSCINCSRTFHGTHCTESCNISCVDRNCYRNGTCVEKCPTNCVSGDLISLSCTRNETGNIQCSNGCIPGYHGYQCNKLCSKYCKGNVCSQDVGSCLNCFRTFHGTNCTESCNNSCVDHNCYMNGTCVETCPSKCVSGEAAYLSCSRNGTGNIQCSNGCVEGYHGLKCEKHCKKNCQVCAQDTGQCNVCYIGWYGQNCNIICGENCLNSSCQAYTFESELTYLCSNNCVDGYRGHQCLDICHDNCSKCLQFSNQSACFQQVVEAGKDSLVGMIVGPVLVIIIAALIIAGIIVYKRRKMETMLCGHYRVKEDASNEERYHLSDELEEVNPPTEHDTKEVNETHKNILKENKTS